MGCKEKSEPKKIASSLAEYIEIYEEELVFFTIIIIIMDVHFVFIH